MRSSALHHVEEHHVAELFLGGEQCQVAADLTCSDEGDLPASHDVLRSTQARAS
jgi:hypothetical protein